MKEQYTISEMAGFFNISSQTLWHYDKIGLLKPSLVEPSNRYRLYSQREFRTLYLIKELKAMGLSLEEIKNYCSTKNLERLEQILQSNSRQLEQRIAELSATKHRTDDYLRMIQLSRRDYNGLFELCQLEPRSAYFIGLNFEICDLERYVEILYGSYAAAAVSQQPHERGHIVLTIGRENICAGRFGVYSGLGFLLDKPVADGNHLAIPGGLYAVTYHLGVYDTIHRSYKKLHRYIRENGYAVNGFATEVSITDIAFTNDPKEFVTALQIPVTPL